MGDKKIKVSDIMGESVSFVKDGGGMYIHQLHYYNPSKKCSCTDEIHSSQDVAELIHQTLINHDRLVEENNRLREALSTVIFVRDTFKNDLEQGFRTRDKEFAVDLLDLVERRITKE